MIELIKRCLDREFAANEIDIRARVEESAWQYEKVTNYRVKLLYGGTQLVMTIYMYAQRPYKPKIQSFNAIEPHKMIRLCEIIQEAFKELERLTTEDDFS